MSKRRGKALLIAGPIVFVVGVLIIPTVAVLSLLPFGSNTPVVYQMITIIQSHNGVCISDINDK